MPASAASRFDRARTVFERSGGLLRMADAIRSGIHRSTLREMVEQGELERVSRGLYQLVDAEPPYPDLAIVAAKVPEGVICLLSALSFHELTTQIPHEVYVAIDRNAKPPRIDYPPIRTFRFSGKAFTTGIETHNIGPVPLRVYSPAKTVVDCFKYRNKLGLDVALEALRDCLHQRKATVDQLWDAAKACRMTQVMRPYLEAMV